MEIREITNKEVWEGFLAGCDAKSFLQSWNWGDFQLGRAASAKATASQGKIWRLGVFDNEKLVGVALVVKIKARRGTFLFVPHGPVCSTPDVDRSLVLRILFQKLKEIAKTEKVDFIRISPLWLENEENKKIFADLGFRNAPMHASAYEATWKLDITLPEEELLKNMRKTTRYLIKKAGQNKNIEIIKSTDEKDLKIYQELNKEVSIRQKFVGFSDDFIKKEFEVFKNDNEVMLLFGKYNGQVAAGAMVVFWSGIGFYHQAASFGQFAKHSIPYLLQWEAIKESKKRGCKIYDFWGFTDPEKFPKHPWAGPTLFKMGFGGFSQKYTKTQDLIISQKYWINYIIEKIRKIKRGL